MAKLNKSERGRLTLVIKGLCLQGYSLGEIQEEIDNMFGVWYSQRCLQYYQDKAFRQEWLAKLEEQNKIIKKWNEDVKPTPDPSEVLAENIYSAVFKKDIEVHEVLINEIME